jgi:hypothetical protein
MTLCIEIRFVTPTIFVLDMCHTFVADSGGIVKSMYDIIYDIVLELAPSFFLFNFNYVL